MIINIFFGLYKYFLHSKASVVQRVTNTNAHNNSWEERWIHESDMHIREEPAVFPKLPDVFQGELNAGFCSGGQCDGVQQLQACPVPEETHG